MDIGGTKILTAVYDPGKKSILAEKKIKTPKNGTPRETLQQIRSVADELLREIRIPEQKIRKMGFAIPGTVNPEEGVIGVAPNLGWKQVPFASITRDIFPWKTHIGNDVNMALWGELHHPAMDITAHPMVYGIFCGTGIGGALAINGHIWSGPGFGAGEIGHIRVVENGEKCGCGNRGCLETMIGKEGVRRFLLANGGESRKSPFYEVLREKDSRIKASAIKKALARKDPSAVKLRKHCLKYLSTGIISLIHIMNPNLILLGGGMMDAFDGTFLDHLREIVKRENIMGDHAKTELVLSRYGDHAGVMGAALAE